MEERRGSKPILNIGNPSLDQFPAILDKATCPICCNKYDRKYAPIVSCEEHAACFNCLKQIVQKAKENPSSPPLCPLCRRKIPLPLRLNEEYIELTKLLEKFESQSKELILKTDNISKRDSDIERKNLQLLEIIKKVTAIKQKSDKLKTENQKLKKTIQALREVVNELIKAKSKAQNKENKQNPEKKNLPSILNKELDIDQKIPLKQLFLDEQLDEENRLNLARKQYKPLHVEFLVLYDLSKIIELNLACNRIESEGFKLLMENSNFSHLTNLNVANNQITQLPTRIESLTQLKYFNIGNFAGEDRKSYNRLRESDFNNMLDQKWKNLHILDVEFDTDSILDDEKNLDRLVLQWPVVSRINFFTSTMNKRVAYEKGQQLSKILKSKRERQGLNRIRVIVISNN